MMLVMIHQENGRSFRSSSIACAIPLFRTLLAAWCSRDRNAFPVVSSPLPAMALWPACHRRRHGNGRAALRAQLSLEQYSVPSETPPITIPTGRSEEHTSELQSLMRISYAVICLKKKNKYQLLTRRIRRVNAI